MKTCKVSWCIALAIPEFGYCVVHRAYPNLHPQRTKEGIIADIERVAERLNERDSSEDRADVERLDDVLKYLGE